MNHVVRQRGGEIPSRSLPVPFPSLRSATGTLTATDKSVTLVSQLSRSSGEWAWWGFRQCRNFAAFYTCLPPSLLFRAVPFIWGRGDVMFCCFCKRGASEESPLCTGLCCERCQKGEGHFFIWHLFPTCSIGWEIHSKNKRQLWPSFLSFFQRAISIWELYLFLSSFDPPLHSGTILQHGNNAARSLPQNEATNKLISVVHTVCMIKACSQECLSLALFFLSV